MQVTRWICGPVCAAVQAWNRGRGRRLAGAGASGGGVAPGLPSDWSGSGCLGSAACVTWSTLLEKAELGIRVKGNKAPQTMQN